MKNEIELSIYRDSFNRLSDYMTHIKESGEEQDHYIWRLINNTKRMVEYYKQKGNK